MCLSCEYNSYRKCTLCATECCKKELYNNDGICTGCFKKMTKKRRCRTCGIIFASGNKLFVHLNEIVNHQKAYDSSVEREVMKNKKHNFNSWMEQYLYLGFRH